MLQNKTYTGIVVDDETLKVARVEVDGNKLKLLSLDKVRLVEPLIKNRAESGQGDGDIFGNGNDSGDEEDIIFGLEDDADIDAEEGADESDELDLEGLDDDLDDLGDIDFDDLDDDSDQIVDTDMVDESDAPASNELLFYNLLTSTDTNRIDLGLSIPSGNTIFQILQDNDFSDTKKKDLKVIVEDRLEALHGTVKDKDQYSYTVRNDGALLLTSIDEEPHLLSIVNRTLELFSGKLFITDILPDEINLLGLIRANYDLDINTVTGVIQFNEHTTRVIFLKGNQLWIVSPIINEGTKDQKFLNTVFSKILFQLDTGEVPNLDRLILCDNSLGEEALKFFKDRFQDVDVSEFKFSEDIFDSGNINKSSVSSFTTAIGAAWSASGFKSEEFPDISFLPEYVGDRQKIFKLQWHGFLLLFLILITPIVANHFYTQNASEINRLTNEANSIDSQIESLEPTVQRYNQISNELSQIQSKLALLNELNVGTLRWSTNLGLINQSAENINSIWFTSLRKNENSTELNGYALSRNRIPQLANTFHGATLIRVSEASIREREVYEFRYVIRDFFEDEEVYTPESAKGINELIED